MFFDRTLFYNQSRVRSKTTPVLAGLTIAVVDMPMHQVHRELFCHTKWWLGYVAHIRNLPAPYRAICMDVVDWIQGDLLFDDPLHLFAQSAAQFSQRLGGLSGHDTANLSILFAAGFGPRSSLH